MFPFIAESYPPVKASVENMVIPVIQKDKVSLRCHNLQLYCRANEKGCQARPPGGWHYICNTNGAIEQLAKNTILHLSSFTAPGLAGNTKTKKVMFDKY